MENIWDTLGTKKLQKRYWLRLGIIGFFIPIVPYTIVGILIDMYVAKLLLGFFGFNIPSVLDDMGINWAEGLFLFVPVLWFTIGAFIGYIYGLIKKHNYKAITVSTSIIIFLTGIGVVYMFTLGSAQRALEERNIKFCDRMSYNNTHKEYCYTDLGKLGDYSICTQSKDERFRNECFNAAASALGECEKIQYPSWEKDKCFYDQYIDVRRFASNNSCSDGNSRVQILCEQYIKKEITDGDLCKKINNNNDDENNSNSLRDDCMSLPILTRTKEESSI